ncbi:hypothetical protein PG984_000644 [Apiospora sp. TS-2023a]
MTGLQLSRWPRFARAPRIDHFAGSIRGISSSSSHNIPAYRKFSRGKLPTPNRDDAGGPRALPEPTLFGSHHLSKRFDTGGEVAAFYRTHQIKGLTVQVCPRHCFDPNHMKYLDKVEHPMRKTMFDMYATWADRPLWYSGASHGAAPIVCSKAKRWIQRGLREALLERGYDRDGRVKQEQTSSAGGDEAARRRRRPCMTFPEVLEAMRQAVTAAEPYLATSQPSQSNGKQYRNQDHKQGNGNPSRSPQAFKKPLISRARPAMLI